MLGDLQRREPLGALHLDGLAEPRRDLAQHVLRVRRTDEDHQLRVHAHDGLRPRPAAVLVGDHLHLINDRHVVLRVRRQHLDGRGNVPRLRIGKALLARDQRTRHARRAHPVPELRRHQPQRGEIHPGLRRGQVLKRRVGLAGIRRPRDQQQPPLTRPRAGKRLVKAMQRDAFRHAVIGRAQRQLPHHPRGAVDELPHRQPPLKLPQLLLDVRLPQHVAMLRDGLLHARDLRVHLRLDLRTPPLRIPAELAEARGQNLRAFRAVQRQHLEHLQRARVPADHRLLRPLRHQHRHVPFAKKLQPAQLRERSDFLPHIAQPRFENGASAARRDRRHPLLRAPLREPLVKFRA